MRKAVFFHNEASREIGMLIGLLLLVIQCAIAQGEDASSNSELYSKVTSNYIKLKLTEGSISCPPNFKAVLFNPDSFRVNDEDSFNKAITWWWVRNEGESLIEASERRFTPEISPIPIRINDKGLLNLFLECKILSLHYNLIKNTFNVEFKSPLDSLFIEKYTSVKCIREMNHHIEVIQLNTEIGMNFDENDKATLLKGTHFPHDNSPHRDGIPANWACYPGNQESIGFIFQNVALNNRPIGPGDAIGAFADRDVDVCCGVAVVPEDYAGDEDILLNVYGSFQDGYDNPNGYRYAEEITFRIWDEQLDQEYNAEVFINEVIGCDHVPYRSTPTEQGLFFATRGERILLDCYTWDRADDGCWEIYPYYYLYRENEDVENDITFFNRRKNCNIMSMWMKLCGRAAWGNENLTRNGIGSGVTVVIVEPYGVRLFDPNDHETPFHQDLPSGDRFYSEGSDLNDATHHGTMVAGVVAAEINTQAIAASSGIAPGVNLYCAYVHKPGWDEEDRVNYIVNLLTGDLVSNVFPNTRQVFNMSWSIPYYLPEIENQFQAAINTAVNEQGKIVVAAAANTAQPGRQIPAGFKNVISVGATDMNYTRSSFSNYYIPNDPDYDRIPDFMAPGEAVRVLKYSTANPENRMDYGPANGTSFSAPCVAAFSAIMLSCNPDRFAHQNSVIEFLTQCAFAIPESGENNLMDKWGNGMINGARIADNLRLSYNGDNHHRSNVSRKNEEITLSNQLSIFPNPANAEINVSTRVPIGNDCQLHINDVQGRTVLKAALFENETASLSVKELSSGRYFAGVYDVSGQLLVFSTFVVLK